MWLSEQERVTLAALGLLIVSGSGLLAWQQRRLPLIVNGNEASAHVAVWDQAIRDAGAVDVNTADASELERLPGVGPALARRIVDYRTARGRLQSPEELLQVKGIGPKTYDGFKDHVTTK